jgi:maleate isomerase
MTKVLGWRRKFGVLGPSTNTIVQPDFEMMRPPGVTNHYSRIFTPNAQAVSNETFMAGTQVIGQNTLDAVRSVMTRSPDYLVMGMSAVTFYGGAKGADQFQARVAEEAGIGVSIGSHSCTAALRAYGGFKRIRSCRLITRSPRSRWRVTSVTRDFKWSATSASSAKAGRRSPRCRRASFATS